jgi:hypothetical protein
MTARERIRRIFSPPAEVSKVDTGLRFTDILFGFVIRELFIRLQNWATLPWFVRWQLIAGTALVLGSWIGFRRSLNRSTYELKFFNLPLLRFVLDQLMVILYFRVAVLTPTDAHPHVDPGSLTHNTLKTLLFIFVLYALWDLSGIRMAHATTAGKPKYGEIKDGQPTEGQARRDWAGFWITAFVLLVLAAVFLFTHDHRLGAHGADGLFIAATGLLLLYRFLKEVRSSWRLP